MATRSTIAIERQDGTVAVVYCHWDGYLEHNGKLLLEHYSDPAAVEQLVGLGNISSLGSEIGEKHDFDNRGTTDQTTFYGRDRGEPGQEARVYSNLDDYIDNHSYEEFDYIMRVNGEWYVSKYGEKYEPLSRAVLAAMCAELEDA